MVLKCLSFGENDLALGQYGIAYGRLVERVGDLVGWHYKLNGAFGSPVFDDCFLTTTYPARLRVNNRSRS